MLRKRSRALAMLVIRLTRHAAIEVTRIVRLFGIRGLPVWLVIHIAASDVGRDGPKASVGLLESNLPGHGSLGKPAVRNCAACPGPRVAKQRWEPANRLTAQRAQAGLTSTR